MASETPVRGPRAAPGNLVEHPGYVFAKQPQRPTARRPLAGSTGCQVGPGIVPFARGLIATAPDRVVWGSDWPQPPSARETMPRYGDLADMLAE